MACGVSVHSGGPCLVEVKYHQHFANKSLGVPLYRTGVVAATLPLDIPGLDLEPMPVPRPEPVGGGLAGGVVAVRLADVGVVDGAGGEPVLVPRSGVGSAMGNWSCGAR